MHLEVVQREVSKGGGFEISSRSLGGETSRNVPDGGSLGASNEGDGDGSRDRY